MNLHFCWNFLSESQSHPLPWQMICPHQTRKSLVACVKITRDSPFDLCSPYNRRSTNNSRKLKQSSFAAWKILNTECHKPPVRFCYILILACKAEGLFEFRNRCFRVTWWSAAGSPSPQHNLFVLISLTSFDTSCMLKGIWSHHLLLLLEGCHRYVFFLSFGERIVLK